MRLIQAILWRVLCVALLLLGIAAFYVDLTTLHEFLIARLPDSAPLRWTIGGCLIAAALIGLVPWPKRTRERRKIAFKGAHGNVSIQLDSVEQTLNRATRKIPEAKRVNARITPSDNARNVHIQADVTLRKPASVSAREVEAKVSEFIVDQTKRILGEETAVTADLNIVDIIIEDADKAAPDEPAKAPPAEARSWEASEESVAGTALEDLEEEEKAIMSEPALPGASLPESEQDQEAEEDDEPASEEEEAPASEEEKDSLW
jgi:hypothetical protein